jgi:hypothetical protein
MSSSTSGAAEFRYVSATGKGEVTLVKKYKKRDLFDTRSDAEIERDQMNQTAAFKSALGTSTAASVETEKDRKTSDTTVRFAEGTKLPSSVRQGGRLRQLKEEERRKNERDLPELQRKVGKANLARDIPIFLGILVFLLFIAHFASDVGTVSTKKSSLSTGKEALAKRAKERLERIEEGRRAECGLFLAPSSIPDAGLSLFVGKNYSVDSVVVSSKIPTHRHEC